jgi:hypothetical protein
MPVFLVVVVGVLALLRFHQIINEIAYSRVTFEREKRKREYEKCMAEDPAYTRCAREHELEDPFLKLAEIERTHKLLRS